MKNRIFSERLIKLMDKSGITQNDLADTISTSQSAISRWKAGSVPNGELVSRLAKFFGVSTEYLLGLDSETMLEGCVRDAEAAGEDNYGFNLRVAQAQSATAADRYFLEKDRADRAEKKLKEVKKLVSRIDKILEGLEET
jgi:transcriptional regulator with XRE-family HTH domain